MTSGNWTCIRIVPRFLVWRSTSWAVQPQFIVIGLNPGKGSNLTDFSPTRLNLEEGTVLSSILPVFFVLCVAWPTKWSAKVMETCTIYTTISWNGTCSAIKLLKVLVCYYMYEFVYQEEKNQSIYLCPFAKLPNMARQLQPMDRLFIPPIPLGEISLAAYYLEAVLRSVVCYRAPPRSA